MNERNVFRPSEARMNTLTILARFCAYFDICIPIFDTTVSLNIFRNTCQNCFLIVREFSPSLRSGQKSLTRPKNIFKHLYRIYYYTYCTSLKNGPVWKNWFIPKTHGRENALYAQNCLNFFRVGLIIKHYTSINRFYHLNNLLNLIWLILLSKNKWKSSENWIILIFFLFHPFLYGSFHVHWTSLKHNYSSILYRFLACLYF